ncbi:MAG: glycoside hydrolase family 88 protein [Clostridia bacterium]|nr:glycoside hydrolase family 88 protein [Clostridia bacterium]
MTDEMKMTRAFIDALTVDAPDADPKAIVEDEDRFFAWDNEHRSRKNGKAFLYDWSYYIGVVMEGLYYMYEAGEGERYKQYVKRYLHAVETDGTLNEYAGYVIGHGLDCYKTASLLPYFYNEDEELRRLADSLWRDLYEVNAQYAPAELGGNYWHVWDNGKPPRYRVWLDGLYMGQVFLARYAALTGNKEALRQIADRFRWVNAELVNPATGLLYHAGNGRGDVCPFHWLRACGWYAMAQADVLECLEGGDRAELAAAFEGFCEAMLKYRDGATGLWLNLIDQPKGDGNLPEASGTAMMSYAMLKGARLGLIDGKFSEVGAAVYAALTREKLTDRALTDVYLVATANGQDNYRRLDYYMPQEGKGVGPYIMAYAEMLKRAK